jgi:hypothetical protein
MQVVRQALERYFAAHEQYPASCGIDGGDDAFGCGHEWFDILKSFTDVETKGNPTQEFLYYSDGHGYMLMHLSPDDWENVQKNFDSFGLLGQNEYKRVHFACKGYGFWTPGKVGLCPDLNAKRVCDLSMLRDALKEYLRDHGHYPVTQGFNGLYSAWAASGPDWIPGLAPRYVAKLPRDPRKNDIPENQYLYISNGKDYKLVCFFPEDAKHFAAWRPDMADSTRQNMAFGFWTKGAADW